MLNVASAVRWGLVLKINVSDCEWLGYALHMLMIHPPRRVLLSWSGAIWMMSRGG